MWHAIKTEAFALAHIQEFKISKKYIFGAYLSKIVCVLLIIWTILKGENSFSLRVMLRNGRSMKQDLRGTHNVAVMCFGHE